jgi:hypothetical protein
MFVLNWTEIISNSISGAITGMFSALGVYFAIRMIKHAEGSDEAKKEKKEEKGVIPSITDLEQGRK